MSAGNGDGGTPYQVLIPPAVLAQFQAWAAEAAGIGRLTEYLAALKAVDTRLRTDPSVWGDSLYDFAVMKAVHRRGMIANWILVWYGVDESCRVVAVRAVAPAPGSPLSNPGGPT